MKTGLVAGFFIPTLLATAGAFADGKVACLDAASKGQRFRDTHKLVEAREQLRICAAAQCPAVIQSDCANWLADVEKALPSVVFTAKSGSGTDLVDVKVSADGQPLVSKLDGQAVPMNAGSHTFHFDGPDGASVDLPILVKEGERNQTVAVTLAAAPAAPTPSQSGDSPQNTANVPGSVAKLPDSAASAPDPIGSSNRWKTAGWAVGGAGVVGLGVATAFGVVAVSDKSAAHCDAHDVCDPGTTHGIKTAAFVSDVGWIVGGVLLATGAALVLFTPSRRHEPAAAVKLAPVVTASGGELVLGGRW